MTSMGDRAARRMLRRDEDELPTAEDIPVAQDHRMARPEPTIKMNGELPLDPAVARRQMELYTTMVEPTVVQYSGADIRFTMRMWNTQYYYGMRAPVNPIGRLAIERAHHMAVWDGYVRAFPNLDELQQWVAKLQHRNIWTYGAPFVLAMAHARSKGLTATGRTPRLDTSSWGGYREFLRRYYPHIQHYPNEGTEK